MSMTKQEQMEQFEILAKPVVKWLKNGAKHITNKRFGEIGFNMDHIFDNEYRFDYKGDKCNTVMCVAGAIGFFNYKSEILKPHFKEYVKKYEPRGNVNYYTLKTESKEFAIYNTHDILFGLFPDLNYDLDSLFFQYNSFNVGYSSVTPDDALKALKNFLKKGVVDWTRVKNR